MTDTELLDWLIDNGGNFMIGGIYDTGCGCCSESIQIPEDIIDKRDMIKWCIENKKEL